MALDSDVLNGSYTTRDGRHYSYMGTWARRDNAVRWSANVFLGARSKAPVGGTAWLVDKGQEMDTVRRNIEAAIEKQIAIPQDVDAGHGASPLQQ